MEKQRKDILWDLISYQRPGYPIAESINESLNNQKSNVLFLANHGLIIGADDIKHAEKIQKYILEKLKIFPRKITTPNKKDFYIINTHMDAGRRDSDRYAREKQLEHIVSVIKKKKDLTQSIKIKALRKTGPKTYFGKCESLINDGESRICADAVIYIL